MLSRSVELAFTLLLVAGLPVLSYHTASNEMALHAPRKVLYVSVVASDWLVAALGALTVLVTRRDWAAIGFRAVSWPSFALWTVVVTAVALAFMAAILPVEMNTRWPPHAGELVRRLIPETAPEKVWAALLLSPTAGLCEEFLYRGFLLTEFSRWFPSGPWAIILSSIAFGMAHCYQGGAGVGSAAVLGVLLAYPVHRLGTLYPSVAAHTLADAIAIVWMVPKLLPRVRKPKQQGETGGDA